MFSALRDAFQYMLRRAEGEAEGPYRARLALTVLNFAIILVLGLHIAWACNRFAPLLPGFATRNDMQNLSDIQAARLQRVSALQSASMAAATAKIDRLIVGQIRDLIISSRTKECGAVPPHPLNQAVRDFALAQLQTGLELWRQQTGYEFERVPTCVEVGN